MVLHTLKFLSIFCNYLTRKRWEGCLFYVVFTLNANRVTGYFFFLTRNIIRSTKNIYYLICVFLLGSISLIKKGKKHLIGSATYSKFVGCKTAAILKTALFYRYFYALGMRLTA